MCADFAIPEIADIEKAWLDRARKHLDNLTKPPGSLGRLEDLAARYVALQQQDPPAIGTGIHVIFAGDHGVAEEGVSAFPQEVTALMVRNFLSGGAAANALARHVGAKTIVVDIGVAADLSDCEGLVHRKIRPGTGNITREPAMTPGETRQAMTVGMDIAEQAAAAGATMIATGEMGIANTTPAAAILCALLPCPPAQIVGRGTGISDDRLLHKVRMTHRALECHRSVIERRDPIEVLGAVGGLEIAAIAGLCLGAAAKRMAVLVDGVISSAGALIAHRAEPKVAGYLFYSHQSAERGHAMLLKALGQRPILDLDMRLGEGTGALLAMSILEAAVKVYREMATFADLGIPPA